MTVETAAPAVDPVVPPAVVAPVAAPAIAAAVETPAITPPVPAPVVTPPALTEPEIVAVQYEPTGDPGLDIALTFVGNLGFGTDHPAMQAAMNWDYTLIEAALAALGPKAAGWQQHVALAKAADAAAKNAADAQAAATTAAVEKAAGGKEAWSAISAWAVTNASPEEKAAINQMFDAGPVTARMAAIAMREAYKAAPGTVVTPADPTRNVSGAVPSNGALNKREYAQAVSELRSRMGRSFETSQEYAALRARLR